MGPSAGKSTLLYAQRDGRYFSGRWAYRGRVISSLNEKRWRDIRAREFGLCSSRLSGKQLTLFEKWRQPVIWEQNCLEAEIRRRAELLGRMNVGAARDRLPAEVFPAGRFSGGNGPGHDQPAGTDLCRRAWLGTGAR